MLMTLFNNVGNTRTVYRNAAKRPRGTLMKPERVFVYAGPDKARVLVLKRVVCFKTKHANYMRFVVKHCSASV